MIVIPSVAEFEKAYAVSKVLAKDLSDVLDKNRLWLEDDNYNKIKEYSDYYEYEYQFSRQNQDDLAILEEKRAQATASVNEIREKMHAPPMR